ncbi:MAG: S8 family serine peptidase, partial [Methermicoccaceae archaeon]
MSYNPKLLGVALLSLLILATCVFGAAIASENPTITKSPSHEGLDGNTYHLTLITGDKLTVVRDEQGRLSIAVDGQKKQDFRVLRTSRGTYVFPKGVDLKKMDTELFNIDYLIDEGYCNMSYLPVLIDYKKDGIMGISEMTPVKELERGGQMSIVRTYASVPTFSARLSVDSVKESGEALEKSPQIERIWLDKKVHASLYDSVPIIDAPRVWQQGYNGSGVEIAILDTGIDDKHPDLDDLDDNASTNDPKVVRAVNFTNDNTTNDLYGHGTYCAAIAAGTGYGETLLHNASMSTYAKLAPHKGEMAASQSLMSVGTPDAYEPDNNYTQASWISTNGTSQHHNFHVAGDHDWVKFNATANTTYKIETSGLGPDCDTYLYLYSTDGTTEMVHNDDNGYSLASLIIWKFGAAGTYYVMVRDYSTSACGNDTYYSLSVSEYVPPAEFTDVYSDHGEDTNLDGMYDLSVVDVGVNVRETGYYGVSASLYEGGTDHYVDYAESYTHLERGVQTVQMKFRGLRLYAKGYNGTYDVRELSLYSEPNDERVSYRENAYTTQSYNYTQFQQYRRYVGVAPAAKLWNVKVLNQSGVGYDSWVIAGIEYAAYGPDGTANTGDEADVISMSLGGMPTYGGDPLSQAVSNAVSHGVVVAVAAGNSGPWYYTIESPGTAGEAITVGASTK